MKKAVLTSLALALLLTGCEKVEPELEIARIKEEITDFENEVPADGALVNTDYYIKYKVKSDCDKMKYYLTLTTSSNITVYHRETKYYGKTLVIPVPTNVRDSVRVILTEKSDITITPDFEADNLQ